LLDALLSPEAMPETLGELEAAYRQRQEALCERIRAGDFDGAEDERELVRYLVLETTNRVRISAPAELKE
jgi:hypothetical protein